MPDRILLVDDEQHIINALRRVLQDEPYEILAAASAAEALAILKKTAVHVVVSDERMPGMSGSEFLAEVSRKYPDTIRIILSGHASLEAAIRAINEGEIFRFLTKPWNEVDLRVTIRQGLQRQKLVAHNRRLLNKVRQQKAVLQDLEKRHPGITTLKTDADGVIIVEDADMAEIDTLLASFS